MLGPQLKTRGMPKCPNASYRIASSIVKYRAFPQQAKSAVLLDLVKEKNRISDVTRRLSLGVEQAIRFCLSACRGFE